MADISKLEQQADLLMQNVSGWETSTLERIGNRIGKYGKMSLADVKSINNIAVVKQDMDAITKELAKVTGYNISQIEQMYGELLEEQHLANQPLYDYRGKAFVPFAENRELQAIARAYAKTTGETMINLAKIGGSNLGFIDKDGKFKAIEKMYTEALDKAVIQVSTGATDFHTAMRDTIVEMGGSGIRINYADSGITRRLDTAVRQSLLWGAKQASIEYNQMIGEELGCDGIEIDYHSNPRPSHEEMQGQQYSIVGEKTINGVTYLDAYDEGIDSKDGKSGLLNDYGCLHYKTPIILGVSEPRYSEKELARLKEQDKKTYDIDGKTVTGYEATQMMRRLETAIRNEKSIKNMAQSGDSKKLVKDCNAKIKAYQGKYNEISEITGIQGDKKRMSVPRGTATVKGSTLTPKKVEPKTIKGQYKQTDAMNEYDYFSKEQEDFRIKSIQDLTGYDDAQTQKALEALCGTSDEYKGIGTNVPKSWFSGSDTDIRLATDGEFFEKAKVIDDYIENAPKFEGKIYRGLSLDDDTISQFVEGATFKENGNLSSWTSEKDVASMFADGRSEELGKRPVIFETSNPPHGTPTSHLSIFGSEESEVLVSNMRNGEYIIESVSERNGYTYVTMKLKGE
jgi:hypothetical protein